MPKSDTTQMHLRKDKVERRSSEFQVNAKPVPEAKSITSLHKKWIAFQNSC